MSAAFGRWAHQLAVTAASEELTGQVHHWLNLAPQPPLPADQPGGPAGANTVVSARTAAAALPAGLTATCSGTCRRNGCGT